MGSSRKIDSCLEPVSIRPAGPLHDLRVRQGCSRESRNRCMHAVALMVFSFVCLLAACLCCPACVGCGWIFAAMSDSSPVVLSVACCSFRRGSLYPCFSHSGPMCFDL